MLVHYQRDGKDVQYGPTLCGKVMSTMTNGINTILFRQVTCSECQKIRSEAVREMSTK